MYEKNCKKYIKRPSRSVVHRSILPPPLPNKVTVLSLKDYVLTEFSLSNYLGEVIEKKVGISCPHCSRTLPLLEHWDYCICLCNLEMTVSIDLLHVWR